MSTVLVRCPECGRYSQSNDDDSVWYCECHPYTPHFTDKTIVDAKEPLVLEQEDDIEEERYTGCENLRRAIFRGTRDSIPRRFFYASENLEEIQWPNGLKHIGEWAFYATGLRRVNFPNSLCTIKDHAFESCGALSCVTLEKGISCIGSDAFAYCGELQQIEFPQTLRHIKHGAFTRSGLHEIHLPDRLTEIECGVFWRCCSLSKVKFPAGLRVIRAYALAETALRAVELPPSVRSIGACAFKKCKDLAEITWPQELSSIGQEAFCATNLRTVLLPESVSKLGQKAFADCVHLETLVLPKALEHIPRRAFSGCRTLRNVRLPGKYDPLEVLLAFQEAPFLKQFIKEHPELFENGLFPLCAAREIDIRDLPVPAAFRCVGLLPSILKYEDTYQGSENLITVELVEGITTITKNMFRGCSNLRNLKLPESIRRIEDHAFAQCSALKEVTIPDGVEVIEDFAFSGCSALETVHIQPELLRKIPDTVFAGTPYAKKLSLKTARVPHPKILLIGLGGRGTEVLDRLCKMYPRMNTVHTLMLNTRAPITKWDRVHGVWLQIGYDLEMVARPGELRAAMGRKAMQQSELAVRARLAEEYDAAVLVTSLEEGEGSGGTSLLARWMREMALPHRIVACAPEYFGQKLIKNSLHKISWPSCGRTAK